MPGIIHPRVRRSKRDRNEGVKSLRCFKGGNGRHRDGRDGPAMPQSEPIGLWSA